MAMQMLKKRKIIIGVHGLGNKPPEPILERWWKASILEGLEFMGWQKRQVNFDLLYWADILYLHPENPNLTDEDDDLYVDHPYYPAAESIRKAPGKLKIKFHHYLDKLMEEVFLNDDMTINFSSITDKIIHRYFRDLESYYKAKYAGVDGQEYSARDRIRNRLADLLKKHRRKDILLIAHSMGSIVAYDVLTQVAPEIKINTLVTIGSPLGNPIVMSRIAAEQSSSQNQVSRLKTPENVMKKWFNLSDLDDRITINYMLSDDYDENSRKVIPQDFIVSNGYSYKGNKNPHASFGYLRTPEMAGIIKEFMGLGRFDYIGGASRKVRDLIIKVNNKLSQRSQIES